MNFLGVTALSVMGGCQATGPLQDPVAIDTVRRQLIVLPVCIETCSSSFPVNSRNVVCAAHTIGEYEFASVAGYPMFPLLRQEYARAQERSWVDDWIVLASTEERWRYNEIAPNHEIEVGDWVFFGGFPVETRRSHSPLEIVSAEPTILMGKILPKRVGDAPGLWRSTFPSLDPHGMSGGPVAILGDDGRVRVVGALVFGELEFSGFQRRWVVGFSTPSERQWHAARNTLIVSPNESTAIGEFVGIDGNFGIFPPIGEIAIQARNLYLPAYLRDFK